MSQFSKRGREWKKITDAIKDRDGYMCAYQFGNCTYDQDLTVDHIIPLASGGTDDEDNLITACRSCNSSKKHKTLVRHTWIDTEVFTEGYVR